MTDIPMTEAEMATQQAIRDALAEERARIARFVADQRDKAPLRYREVMEIAMRIRDGDMPR